MYTVLKKKKCIYILKALTCITRKISPIYTQKASCQPRLYCLIATSICKLSDTIQKPHGVRKRIK